MTLTVFWLFAMFHPRRICHDGAQELQLIPDIPSLFHSYDSPNLFRMGYFQLLVQPAAHHTSSSVLVCGHICPEKNWTQKKNVKIPIMVFSLRFTLIISRYVQRNSFPGQRSVAITAFGEWVWMTAPAPRWRYGNMNNGVHWLFFNLWTWKWV